MNYSLLAMDDFHTNIIQLIVAYTLAGAFLFTVVVTCLSLIKQGTIVNRGQQKKLFYALVVEIVVIGVGFFGNILKFNPAAVEDAAIAEAKRQLTRTPEELLTIFQQNAVTGPDIEKADVEIVLKGGKLPEAVAIFTGPSAGQVKRKQFARHLLELKRPQEALAVCRQMTNKSEIRNVAKLAVERVMPAASADSDEWTFLCGVYDLLGPIQRKEVFNLMNGRALTRRCQWETHTVESSPSASVSGAVP
jgi:hypothetical protein